MRTFRDLLKRAQVSCAAFLLLHTALLSPAYCQDYVQWRHDYPRARQEALDKGRILVLDFGTQRCYWCKQLDLRTFSNPHVVSLLNDKCIPLKVDADMNPNLAEALRIQNYPTLVFASPDGRVLGSQEGFVEAPVLKELLDRVLAAADPEWMLRGYQEALKAREAGDFNKALILIKPILEEGKGRAVHVRSTQLLHELEQLAAAKKAALPPETAKTPEGLTQQPGVAVQTKPVNGPSLEVFPVPVPPKMETVKAPEPVHVGEPAKPVPYVAAKKEIGPPAAPQTPSFAPPSSLDSTQESRAVVVVSEMARIIKGTFTSRPGAQMLITLTNRFETPEQMRVRQAQELLNQAHEDYRRRQYLACLDRCELLTSSYGDLSESLEAHQMINEIKKNPEWIKLACDQLNQRLSNMYLGLAETWLKKGEPQQAIFYLERVVQTAPNSRHAETAQIRLAQLQGQPLPKLQDPRR